MKRSLALFALIVGAASGAFADETPSPEKKPVEFRRHYVLRNAKDKVIHFEVTSVTRLTDDLEENLLLVNDLDHGSLILERRSSYADQAVSYTIYDRKKEEFVRTAFNMPFTAKTRLGTLEEAARNPELRTTPTLMTISTKGGEWRGVDAHWDEWQQLRSIRHAVRPTVSFHLLEAIERLRGTVFATSDGVAFYTVVGRYVVYQTSDDTKIGLEEVNTAPDCDFDKSFGLPCTDAQQKRIRKAAEEGRIPDRY